MEYSWRSDRILTLILVAVMLSACNSESEEELPEGDPAHGGSAQGSPPSIWGDPATSVIVGSHYVFAPESDDPDGDVLSFEIVNAPAWTDFDDARGVLQGVPAEGGTHSGIVISVTDGKSVASLPAFSITVESNDLPDDDDDGGNGGGTFSLPPSISGQPNNSVVVDTAYSFRPSASDPDGDTLSFSIDNKPQWARFNTTSGRLSGTPDNRDIGTTNNIRISVTDGEHIASLNPFSITVEAAALGSKTITWTAPTLNEDGSPLTDLAGYRLYYGTEPGQYNQTIVVDSAGVTSYLIENLAYGTYHLVMSSVNSANVESSYSAMLTFDVDD